MDCYCHKRGLGDGRFRRETGLRRKRPLLGDVCWTIICAEGGCSVPRQVSLSYLTEHTRPT